MNRLGGVRFTWLVLGCRKTPLRRGGRVPRARHGASLTDGNRPFLALAAPHFREEGDGLRRILRASPGILCVLFALYPAGKAIGALCGYDLVLRSPPATLGVLAALSLAVLVALLLTKTVLPRAQAFCAALLLPLSIVNGLVCVFESDWKATIVFVLVCCACSLFLFIQSSSPFLFKMACTGLSALLVAASLFAAFVGSVLGDDFVSNATVKAVPSPTGGAIADVIDSNQGVLGGDTLVVVRDTRGPIHLGLLDLSKSPLCVYTGEWGESTTMRISWVDEQTLLINGLEYSVH